MADRVTTASLFVALVDALAAAFIDSKFAVWPHPPSQTALPAVWPQLGSGGGPSSGRTAPVTLEVVAAIAPQTALAEITTELDAIDRLDAMPVKWAPVESRGWQLQLIQLGGVDHTAVVYTLTISRSTC